MKLKLITTLMLAPAFSYGATNVAFTNLNGLTFGYPVVDNNGVPLDSADFSIQVGTFTDEFIGGIGALDPVADDSVVINAFSPSGGLLFLSHPTSLVFSTRLSLTPTEKVIPSLVKTSTC